MSRDAVSRQERDEDVAPPRRDAVTGPDAEEDPHARARSVAMLREETDAAPVDAVSGADEAPRLGHALLGGGTHTVARGETWATIARAEYGSAGYAEDLAAFNPELSGRRPPAGAEIALPKIVVPLLPALVTFFPDEERFLRVVLRQSATEWATFLANLDDATYARHAPMLARAELFRTAGMTNAEMAEIQRAHIEREAAAAGRTVEEEMSDFVNRGPRRDDLVDEWDLADDAQRERWNAEFPAVRDRVIASAPPDVAEAIATARRHGGGEIVWAPERMGAGATAKARDWNVWVGVAWLKAAQVDPAHVWGTLLHELAGHPTYAEDGADEDYLAGPIMAEMMASLPPEQREHERQRVNAYRYMETEIFAELYEWSRDHRDAPTDHPFDELPGDGGSLEYVEGKDRVDDVKAKLEQLQDGFALPLALGIVRGIWIRVQRDEHIGREAKQRFVDVVDETLGLKL